MATTSTDSGGTAATGFSNNGIVVAGVVVGFFAVPALAGAAPELINGLLLLLIIGTLLMNSGRWLPYLIQFGSAFNAPPPRK
jgi:hypothetical protein